MPNKQARSTWGTKRKKGNVWELRYTVAGERRNETFRGSAKEADRRLAALRIKYEDKDADITLEHFWEGYYELEMEERLAVSTIPGYRRVWRIDIKPAFGDVPLGEISPRMIQEWLSPMTRGKAKHAKAILSAILSRAFALGFIDDNPAQRRFVMPKENAPGQRSREIMNLDELVQVYEACRGESWEAAYILAAFGGASREEAFSPKPDEVYIQGDYAIVPIVRGVQRLEGEVTVLDWTKNEFRQRDLVIPPPFSERLLALAKDAQSRGDEWLTDDGFGMPMCPNLGADRFKKWFIGKPYKFVPFGNLRNSYGTVMEGLGIDGMMVSKIMGHSQPTTFYKHYFRPSTQDKLRAIDEAIRES